MNAIVQSPTLDAKLRDAFPKPPVGLFALQSCANEGFCESKHAQGVGDGPTGGSIVEKLLCKKD